MKFDPFKNKFGKSFEEQYRIPSFEESFNKRIKQNKSKWDLRLLGTSVGDHARDIYMREEDREFNFHIIGGSRQGKSKYLEYHIKKDIDMSKETGFGLCLIDPSDFGATFNAVLDYCASINHQKVCIIDPNTLYDYSSVACIQPLNPDYVTKSAHGVKDAINMLLGSSEANTQNIQENLDALFRFLATENLSLHEAAYFADYENPHWKPLIENAKGVDAQTLREKFKTYPTWKAEFTTTVRRLKDFRVEPIASIVGASKGVDFKKMVDDGWIILCNLFPEPHLTPKMSTFLGILIISQIIQSVDILQKENGGNWGKRFYLYIDEAGSFATPQLKQLLDNKSKSGLNLIFAHHYFDQFEKAGFLSAIKNNTGVKVMFAVRGSDDAMKMLSHMKFDNPKEAYERYKNLPRQHAVIMENRQLPIEIITPDVDPTFISDSIRKNYIRERLEDPWYLPKYEIEQQIQSRIKPIKPVDNDNDIKANSPMASQPSSPPNSKINSNTSKAKPETLLDRLQRGNCRPRVTDVR